MTMNPIGRMKQNTSSALIEEFLNKGGAVTKCEDNARTEEMTFNSGFYGRKRKKQEPTKDEES